jgi:hypothetical protein
MRPTMRLILIAAALGFLACSSQPSTDDKVSSVGGGKGDEAGDQYPGYKFGCSQATIEAEQDRCQRTCGYYGKKSLGIKYCYASNEQGEGDLAAGICADCACGDEGSRPNTDLAYPYYSDFAYYSDLGAP